MRLKFNDNVIDLTGGPPGRVTRLHPMARVEVCKTCSDPASRQHGECSNCDGKGKVVVLTFELMAL